MLKELGYENVSVKVGDGYNGWSECGPFDAVIVTAALGHVPPSLIEQLKVGGRLIMPLGPPEAPQQLTLIEKIAPSETRTHSVILVRFVPLYPAQGLNVMRRRSTEGKNWLDRHGFGPCPCRSARLTPHGSAYSAGVNLAVFLLDSAPRQNFAGTEMSDRSLIFNAKGVQMGYIEDSRAFDLAGRARCNYARATGNLTD